MKYKYPFHVQNTRIVDADGVEVKLWGVNYYAPFNHNYINLKEKGTDLYKAIDRDIEDFLLLGINLVRMHVYDREITDVYGNIVENEHTRLFDYLIEKLANAGIYAMLTPIVWYNTVEIQKDVSDGYAYWSLGSNQNWGFSNLYAAHELIWNENAIAAQLRYIEQFFTRRNGFSGLPLTGYEHVIAMEVSNESIYPSAELLRHLREAVQTTANPYKRQECELVRLYDEHLARTGKPDSEEGATLFCAGLVGEYLHKTFTLVDNLFDGKIIKSHIFYGFENKALFECLRQAPIDAISITAYIPNSFDTAYNDAQNIAQKARELYDYYLPLKELGKAFICYEFDEPTTLLSRGSGILAYMLAAFGVQIASYFTYCPKDVAEYNPGWVVHYMNLEHTPNKAAALAAGKEIFQATGAGAPMFEDDTLWQNEYMTIDIEKDLVRYYDGTKLLCSALTEEAVNRLPEYLLCFGSNKLITTPSRGIYVMKKTAEKQYRLTVLPNQKYVNDPFRGRSFRFMANRYINVNEASVVSRTMECGYPMTLSREAFGPVAVRRVTSAGRLPVSVENHTFHAEPGVYEIELN